jgi:predicted dehydrogenase
MGHEYAKVLQHLGLPFRVLTRTAASAQKFAEVYPEVEVFTGGEAYLTPHNAQAYAHFILANSVETLPAVLAHLMPLLQPEQRVLAEKPVGLSSTEVQPLAAQAQQLGAQVFVAYNRRFHRAVELLQTDLATRNEEIVSANFEFTEWAHRIVPDKFAPETLQRWAIGNSSHVLDLFVALCGLPHQLHCHTAGQLPWHPAGSRFAGSGITTQNVLFSYHANWESAGRWSLEVLTPTRKYILRPLERLAYQDRGSIQTHEWADDYAPDIHFKPGLLKMVEAFLAPLPPTLLCTLAQQANALPVYEQIAGYAPNTGA